MEDLIRFLEEEVRGSYSRFSSREARKIAEEIVELLRRSGQDAR